MRYYEPAGVERVLAQILAEPSLAGGVVHRSTIPARTADFVPMPEWLDPRIVAGLGSRGITSLYRHQAEAVEAVRAGEDVVVVTPTASGKSLCYLVPTLQALADALIAQKLLVSVPLPDADLWRVENWNTPADARFTTAGSI